MARLALLAAAIVITSTFGTATPSAQTSGGTGIEALPSFEVASVRRNPGQPGGLAFPRVLVYPGGRFVAQLASLRQILTTVYPEFALPGQIVGSPSRIVGGPSWMESERFDIEATAPGNPPRDDMLMMVRRLLAERFKLQVHVEPRQMDVYALVRARSDGELGPGLREAAACQASDGSHGAFAAAAPKAGELPPCGFLPASERGLYRLSARSMPLSSLVPLIQMQVDRPVLDRTELRGNFAIELEFAHDTALRTPAAGAGPVDAGPSIFAALPQQLGLRLEARKEPLDVLVIDSVSMPTPN